MSRTPRVVMTAFVLMILLPALAVAAVKLRLPSVTAADIPVWIQVSTLSNNLHGTSGSDREPVFVAGGESVTLQPPFSIPPFFAGVWVIMFHPDYLPVSLVSSNYSTVVGYTSVPNFPMMALEMLRQHPTLLLRYVRHELADGWVQLVEPRTYPGRLLEHLDTQGSTPQNVARFRDYYLRFRSIIDDIKDVDLLCADFHQSPPSGTQTASTLWRTLGVLCAEPDATAREQRFGEFWQMYFGDIEKQLKKLHQRFWPRVGRGQVYDAFLSHYFMVTGDVHARRPLRNIWGEDEITRLVAHLGQPDGALTSRYQVRDTREAWEAEGGLIRHSLRMGGYRFEARAAERCVGFSYKVDASRYFIDGLPDTVVEYRNQRFCYDHDTGQWHWPKSKRVESLRSVPSS